MGAQILNFPRPKAKPRPVLVVPTSDLVVQLWAQMQARIVAFHLNPCPHNEHMMGAARARYVTALDDEKFPA